MLRNSRALLIDTNFSPLKPFVRELAARGFTPAALVISHRHVAGTGDAAHPQAMVPQVPYEDPIGHPLLAEFGLEAIFSVIRRGTLRCTVWRRAAF